MYVNQYQWQEDVGQQDVMHCSRTLQTQQGSAVGGGVRARVVIFFHHHIHTSSTCICGSALQLGSALWQLGPSAPLSPLQTAAHPGQGWRSSF